MDLQWPLTLIHNSFYTCRVIQGHQNGMTNDKQYHLRDCLPKLKTLWGSVNCVMYTTIKPCDKQTLIFDVCGMSQNCRQMFTLVTISPYIYDIGQWSTWYISCLLIIVIIRCLWQCTHNYTNLRNIKTKSGSLSYLHFAYSCVHD